MPDLPACRLCLGHRWLCEQAELPWPHDDFDAIAPEGT